jgi:hypothetical protein
MESKPWYLSRTIWGAVIGVIAGGGGGGGGPGGHLWTDPRGDADRAEVTHRTDSSEFRVPRGRKKQQQHQGKKKLEHGAHLSLPLSLLFLRLLLLLPQNSELRTLQGNDHD